MSHEWNQLYKCKFCNRVAYESDNHHSKLEHMYAHIQNCHRDKYDNQQLRATDLWWVVYDDRGSYKTNE